MRHTHRSLDRRLSLWRSMSRQTRDGDARARRSCPNRRRQQGMARPRGSDSTEPRFQPHQFGLLIDENLTPALVKVALRRGFPARHVNDVNLRTAKDAAVARYALRHNLV